MIPISDSVKAARFPFINIALIAITCYVFYLQLTAPDPEAFIRTYALIPANVDLNNYASLLPFFTSMFLHGGFLHIISNMLFLWVFGDNVEGHLPPFIYIFLYIGSGLVAGISQYLIMPDSSIPMLGASGAVAGALGAYFAWFPKHRIKTFVPIFGFFTFTEISASFMLGYWFVLQLISGAASIPGMGNEGGVAFFAHIGGFVAGFIFAKVFGKKEPQYHEAIEGRII
jgi:membrane associated rhomboid family serine protease